ncbi:hypothetical protein [Bradyrhizobium embrapense]
MMVTRSNAGLVDGPGTAAEGPDHSCLQLMIATCADCCSELKLNHDTLAKLTVTIIVLVALLVWRVADQKRAIACGLNCPTDLSANRKPAQ